MQQDNSTYAIIIFFLAFLILGIGIQTSHIQNIELYLKSPLTSITREKTWDFLFLPIPYLFGMFMILIGLGYLLKANLRTSDKKIIATIKMLFIVLFFASAGVIQGVIFVNTVYFYQGAIFPVPTLIYYAVFVLLSIVLLLMYPWQKIQTGDEVTTRVE